MMKAWEEMIDILEIEECIECHCNVGEDWEYVDFTAKSVIKCPQCGELYRTDLVTA